MKTLYQRFAVVRTNVMLGQSSCYGRRSRFLGSPTTTTSVGNQGTYLAKPRLPLRSNTRPKPLVTLSAYSPDSMGLTRTKRLKPRKVNGFQKMDTNKKKPFDYTEMAYREAVSKLKYLLAESYSPRVTSGKNHDGIKSMYQVSASKVDESADDTDDRSMMSDSSKAKDIRGNFSSTLNSYSPVSKSLHPARAFSNLALSMTDLQSVPPEITSFIEKQEEYIEQLERESQYCKEELRNLLGKVKEVITENEVLHNRNKNNIFKNVLVEHQDQEEDCPDLSKGDAVQSQFHEIKNPIAKKVLEGPSIIFESRISELEAQLTQAKLELRKVREDNQASTKRLCENCLNNSGSEVKAQLEQALRTKCETEAKFEEMQKALASARDREADALQKSKRTSDLLQQVEFDKNQAEKEIRRMKDELERQHEKLREVSQDANRRIAEERQQVERRYSQQVEQLSADVASHWDAASKSQLESEKQRREMTDLRRELAQKQMLIDNLKKEMQSKISSLQSDLNEALSEKDATEQEVLSAKLAAERNERQARQEHNRLQTEINSYKQRLERADADIMHCRRENLRLSEQIASLEKEISMSKITQPPESHTQNSPSVEKEKELTSMIMDMETKHAATVAGLEGALSNQATLVSRLTAECQSLTQRLEANDLKHKEEMASLQNNIEYLSRKICDSINSEKDTSIPNQNVSLVEQNIDIAATNEPVKLEAPQQSTFEDYNEMQTNECTTNETQNINTIEAEQPFEPQNEKQGKYFNDMYQPDNQQFDAYSEQQYNQYDQYNPTEYQDQQYPDNEQHSQKDITQENEYHSEERVNDLQTASSDLQTAH